MARSTASSSDPGSARRSAGARAGPSAESVWLPALPEAISRPGLTKRGLARRADPLLDAARPVLDDAAARLADTDVSLLLVDHECRMVTRVAFGTTVERRLDAIGASPGVPFGEDVVGTTALGTPAETRGGIVVNSSEHYLDQFKSISCFGQPIIHPATRRLAGIICMSEIADRINPLAIPVVNGIVADIADRHRA